MHSSRHGSIPVKLFFRETDKLQIISRLHSVSALTYSKFTQKELSAESDKR